MVSARHSLDPVVVRHEIERALGAAAELADAARILASVATAHLDEGNRDRAARAATAAVNPAVMALRSVAELEEALATDAPLEDILVRASLVVSQSADALRAAAEAVDATDVAG